MATPPPPEFYRLKASLEAHVKAQDAINKAYNKAMYDVPYHLQPTLKEWLASQNKAENGEVSQDAMRYALTIKPKHLAIGGQGGSRNWLKGSVEQVIKPLKQTTTVGSDPAEILEEMNKQWTPEEVERIAQTQPNIRQIIPRQKAELQHKIHLNQWIERNLGNYIRKYMATHDDPIRKLAEEGIIHIPSEQVGSNRYEAPSIRRRLNQEALGKSEEAQAWEDAADVAMGKAPVKHLLEGKDIGVRYGTKHIEPWMEKVDPKTEIFFANEEMHPHYLGFDHLVDVLKEDLASGRIRPEQLSKVSIEHAVRRAHEYDQEKKRKRAETALKATEDMPVVHEYPEAGMKWIELAPKEVKSKEDLGDLGLQAYFDYKKYNGDEAYALKAGQKADAQKYLAEALKYEGDTMGHCVGGYCPDVLEGRSRIFSLRDAKNEPHVTIEVQPIPASFHDKEKWFGHQPSELQQKINEEVKAVSNEMGDTHKNYARAFSSVVDKYLKELPPSIKQIKGKGNAKPHKKYIPFVQHFVKSGDWSDVGDIKNAEMIKHEGKYLTKQEHDDWLLNQLKPDNKATGGITHAHHLDIEERAL